MAATVPEECHDSCRSGVLGSVRDVQDEWRERLLSVYPSLRRFAGVVGSPETSPDDLVHDAIVSVLRGGGLDHVDDLEAYMRRPIANLASNERRRLGRQRRAVRRNQAGTVAGVPDAYPSDLAHLAALTPSARAVLFMHYVEGASFEEIASVLGMRSNAVRQAAHRARRQLHINEAGLT